MSTPNNITVGHAAVHPSPAMIPTPPECGSPCAMCETQAHLLAKAREELEAVRKGSAKVCRELREEIARLREDKERLDWLASQYWKFREETSDTVAFRRYTLCMPPGVVECPVDLRAAIDAARAQGGAK